MAGRGPRLAAEETRLAAERRRQEIERERQEQRVKDAEARGADARDFRAYGDVPQAFTARTYQRVMLGDLPADVRDALRDERLGGNVIYYRYEKNGLDRFAAHYSSRDGRRMELTLSETGRTLDRVDLADAVATRDRDRRDPRDADRDLTAVKIARTGLPADALNQLERETRDGRDVTYYRYDAKNRDPALTVYAARFTNDRGRSTEVRVNQLGRVLETIDLSARNPLPGPGPLPREDAPRGGRMVAFEDLPAGVRDSFRRETRGMRDVDYFELRREGRTTYSTRYTTDSDRRMEMVVDAGGRLEGREELLCRPRRDVNFAPGVQRDTIEWSVTMIQESLLDTLRHLSEEDQRRVLRFAESLRTPTQRKDPRGMFAGRGVSITAEEIDAVRREAWAGFPRDFPDTTGGSPDEGGAA